MRKITIPDLLTFNGGYVDAAGFIVLHGLFTAHVTGNFVTIGAGLVNGTSGVVGKLLVLPVFCLIVLLARLADQRLARSNGDAVHVLVVAMVLLLAAAATLAVAGGPFAADSLGEIAIGMVLVAAMAIQNVLHRAHFSRAPPTTLMTGSTTQATMDIADLWRGKLPSEERAVVKARCVTLARSVGIFALGCAFAALACAAFGMRVFVLPPMIAALTLVPVFRAVPGGKTA